MKSFIRQKLRESLDEMAPKPKPVFGMGTYHTVYSSVKNPNILYKLGTENTVNNWVDIFQKYPQYFPKVYRVFPSKKDPEMYIVAIEKLNTKQAEKDLKIIDEFLFAYSDELSCNGRFLEINTFFTSKCFGLVEDKLEETDNGYLVPLFQKWAKFLREVYPIIEAELKLKHGGLPDLHSGNVAYDKLGNIKLIDI